MIEVHIHSELKPAVIIDGKKRLFNKWEDAVLYAFKECVASDDDEIVVAVSKSRFKELQKKKGDVK